MTVRGTALVAAALLLGGCFPYHFTRPTPMPPDTAGADGKIAALVRTFQGRRHFLGRFSSDRQEDSEAP
jgi:hypothetical protein